MTSFRSEKADPVTSKAQLVETLAAGSKPTDQWRVGTEHEKFPYYRDSFRPVPHEGNPGSGRGGIRALLEGLTRFGWEGVPEDGHLISLRAKGKGTVSLEPGGQFELSGVPLDNVHQTCGEIAEHLAQVKTVGDELGIGMLGLGFTPDWTRADIPWMPKGRYLIMRGYMPRVGTMGLDMMARTCTVQANLDYGSEADMVKKLRVALALQPLVTALWANSPFTEGRPNGALSQRGVIWQNTDPARTGLLPFAFEDGMGFERYVDYLLDVPMYFVFRGRHVDVAGQSFRDFMAGKLDALPGQVPTVADWFDHMSTAFPEARVKNYIEVRGADCGARPRLCALPALWVGLFYDTTALDAAWDLAKGWTGDQRLAFYREVPTKGLKAVIAGRSGQDLALAMLDIAEAGLKARNRVNSQGQDEVKFLAPLREIAASGITPAEQMLALYRGAWGGDVTKAYEAFSY
jgi:glutamate--cysteine ligase